MGLLFADSNSTNVWETIWDAILAWIYGFFDIDIIMNAVSQGKPIPVQRYLQAVFSGILAFFAILTAYRLIYMLLGLFGKARHYEEAPKDKRYGSVVPTWNEEKVIANLIRDIRSLDYLQELIDIFVVAHNCADKTAEAAKQAGAKVYELSNPNERTKGFALKHFFEELMKEYDIEKDFYAFTVLDADSTVHPNYIAAINNYLQASGVDECVGYLNCKNLSENWVSAMCGIQVFLTFCERVARPFYA